MRRRMLSALALGGGVFMATAGSAAPLNYAQDFESLSDGATAVPGWQFLSTATNMVIKVDAASAYKDGQKSLMISDTETTSGNNLQALYTFTGDTKVIGSADFWVHAMPPVGTTGQVSVYLSGGGSEAARIDFNQDTAGVRTITARFGSATQNIGTFALDTKYSMQMTADAGTDTWGVSINGGSVQSGNFKNSVNLSTIDSFSVRVQGATNPSKVGTYYLDNVTLVPEPVALVSLLGMGGLAMLRRRPA